MLEQRRHIGVNAWLQILQRDKTPVRQPQPVAIEAGLALGEGRLNFGVRREAPSVTPAECPLSITFVSHCMQTAVRGSPAEAKPIEPLGNRVVTYNLALTGGTRSIHLQRVVAHDRLLRFTGPPGPFPESNVLVFFFGSKGSLALGHY